MEFKNAQEVIDFAKSKELRRGFYQKGKRIQFLIGFDTMGFMQVTTPAQVRKGRQGKAYSVNSWNMLDEGNMKKLDWFLKADFVEEGDNE